MINKFSVFQPNGWDNSIAPITIIHKLVNQMNELIDTVNNITGDEHDYTDVKVAALRTEFINNFSTIENEINAVQSSLVALINEKNTERVNDITELTDNLSALTTTVNGLITDMLNLEVDLTSIVNTNYDLLKTQIDLLQYQLTVNPAKYTKLNSLVDGRFISLTEMFSEMYERFCRAAGNTISKSRFDFMFSDSFTDYDGKVYNTNNKIDCRYGYPASAQSQVGSVGLKFTLPSLSFGTGFLTENFTGWYVKRRDDAWVLADGELDARSYSIMPDKITVDDMDKLKKILDFYYSANTNTLRNYSFFSRWTTNISNANTYKLPKVFKTQGVMENSALMFFYLMKTMFLLKNVALYNVGTGQYYTLFDIYIDTDNNREWCCSDLDGDGNPISPVFTASQCNTIKLNLQTTLAGDAAIGAQDQIYFNAVNKVCDNKTVSSNSYIFDDYGNLSV